MALTNVEATSYTSAHDIYKGVGKRHISTTKLVHLISLQQIENDIIKKR